MRTKPRFVLPQLLHDLQQVNIAFRNVESLELLHARIKLFDSFIARLRLGNNT